MSRSEDSSVPLPLESDRPHWWERYSQMPDALCFNCEQPLRLAYFPLHRWFHLVEVDACPTPEPMASAFCPACGDRKVRYMDSHLSGERYICQSPANGLEHGVPTDGA